MPEHQQKGGYIFLIHGTQDVGHQSFLKTIKAGRYQQSLVNIGSGEVQVIEAPVNDSMSLVVVDMGKYANMRPFNFYLKRSTVHALCFDRHDVESLHMVLEHYKMIKKFNARSVTSYGLPILVGLKRQIDIVREQENRLMRLCLQRSRFLCGGGVLKGISQFIGMGEGQVSIGLMEKVMVKHNIHNYIEVSSRQNVYRSHAVEDGHLRISQASKPLYELSQSLSSSHKSKKETYISKAFQQTLRSIVKRKKKESVCYTDITCKAGCIIA